DKIDLIDLERIEHAGNVFRLGLFVITAGRPRRQSKSSEVRHDHGVIAYQLRGKRRPHVAGLAIAVQQDDRGARAADAHIDLRSIGEDVHSSEARRVRLHCGQCGCAQNKTERRGGSEISHHEAPLVISPTRLAPGSGVYGRSTILAAAVRPASISWNAWGPSASGRSSIQSRGPSRAAAMTSSGWPTSSGVYQYVPATIISCSVILRTSKPSEPGNRPT